MIVYLKVFIVLLISHLNCEVNGKRDDGDNHEFYIEIGVNGSNDQPVKLSQNASYPMIVGKTLKLTCRHVNNGLLRWTDDSSVGTGNYSCQALSLVITPDEDDINHKFACRSYFEGKIKIIGMVTLVVKDANQLALGPGDVVFKKKGDPWRGQCDSVVYHQITDDPNTQTHYYLKPFKRDRYLSLSLNETFDEVILYCIKYENVKKNDAETLKHVERKKTKFTLCLDRGEEENARRKQELEGSEVKKKDSQSNAAAIVGGVLGAVIFVLLALLLGLGYKTMRRRAPDDRATEVVYAEIEERLTAPPPPPPRNPILYAQIVGSLVPKEPAQTDNSTTTGQEKDDLYCTITSVANDPDVK